MGLPQLPQIWHISIKVIIAVPKTDDTGSCPVCATMESVKESITNAWWWNLGLSAGIAIFNDKRLGDRTLNAHDMVKMDKIIEEWEDVINPILSDLDSPMEIIVDMFFDDYAAAKEKILDSGAKKKIEYLEKMAAFGEVIKKIDEKI